MTDYNLRLNRFMMYFIHTNHSRSTRSLIILILLAASLITGCGDSSTTSSTEEDLEGAQVVIKPESASLEVDEELDFSAFVISATGDTVNEELDINWNWRSSNPNVFTVNDDGNATARNSGEAHCIVEATTANNKIVAKLVPIGLDSARILIF